MGADSSLPAAGLPSHSGGRTVPFSDRPEERVSSRALPCAPGRELTVSGGRWPVLSPWDWPSGCSPGLHRVSVVRTSPPVPGESGDLEFPHFII